MYSRPGMTLASGEKIAVFRIPSLVRVRDDFVAQGGTVILHCHWLSFLEDVLHTNLAAIAVIFSQNDSVASG